MPTPLGLPCGRCGTRSISGKTNIKISETVKWLFRAGKDLDTIGIPFHPPS